MKKESKIVFCYDVWEDLFLIGLVVKTDSNFMTSSLFLNDRKINDKTNWKHVLVTKDNQSSIYLFPPNFLFDPEDYDNSYEKFTFEVKEKMRLKKHEL